MTTKLTSLPSTFSTRSRKILDVEVAGVPDGALREQDVTSASMISRRFVPSQCLDPSGARSYALVLLQPLVLRAFTERSRIHSDSASSADGEQERNAPAPLLESGFADQQPQTEHDADGEQQTRPTRWSGSSWSAVRVAPDCACSAT